MLTQQQWSDLANYSRTKLVSSFDPADIFAEKKGLRTSLAMPYKGLYISIADSGGELLGSEGFMLDKSDNVLDGADTIVQNLFTSFKEGGTTVSKIQSGSFNFTLISAINYLTDPLQWDENKDGIFFQWGQNYVSMFLSWEIQKMGLSKVGILDRLCMRAGVPSSLWRYPEGLIWVLKSHSFSA